MCDFFRWGEMTEKKEPGNIIYYTHLGKTIGDQIRSAS